MLLFDEESHGALHFCSISRRHTVLKQTTHITCPDLTFSPFGTPERSRVLATDCGGRAGRSECSEDGFFTGPWTYKLATRRSGVMFLYFTVTRHTGDGMGVTLSFTGPHVCISLMNLFHAWFSQGAPCGFPVAPLAHRQPLQTWRDAPAPARVLRFKALEWYTVFSVFHSAAISAGL